MSKRGSRNARLYAGKSWSVKGRKGANRKSASEKKAIRKRAKELRIASQFNRLCEKFDFKKAHDETFFSKELSKFIKQKSKVRTKSLQNVKSFKLYCYKYGVDFTLKNYLSKGFDKTNFKRDFPDVYFFNVHSSKKQNSTENHRIKPATNKLGDFLGKEK